MPYLKRIPENPEPIDCRILTAALDLFVENGYHNVSVHEIQKCADVSIGSIYNHFGGKDGIASKLYDHIVNEIDELVDDIASKNETPLVQIKEIIRELFEHTETHSNIIAFAFHTKHSEFLEDKTLISNTAPFSKITALVESAMAQGELRQINTDVATASIVGAMLRMIQLRLDGIIEEPLSEYYSTLLDTVLNGLQQTDITDNSVAIAAVN